MLELMLAVLRAIWTSPNSLIGLLVGVMGLALGGRVQWRRGCLEFHGGLTRWLLERTPISASAMTLGNTILGKDRLALDLARDHEQVHVRQYGIWGPFFVPAYLGAGLYLWLSGKHPYWDNPFEVEAYRKAAPLNPPE